MSGLPRIRVGAVSYLNTKPLIYQIERFAPQAELVLDLPSRLADQLASGDLDVALIPSIEFFEEPRYQILSDACIACRGPVLSVKLFSRVPLEKMRTLSLDEGSRTSAALVQILLDERFGIRPELSALPIGSGLDKALTDATLLIGDRAIHAPVGRFEAVWDLGDEWCRFTGLPFVFAMWAARSDANLGGIERALVQARDLGTKNLDKIADGEAASLGLTRGECERYLRESLHFHLGPSEQRGLERFCRLAHRIGLTQREVEFGISSC